MRSEFDFEDPVSMVPALEARRWGPSEVGCRSCPPDRTNRSASAYVGARCRRHSERIEKARSMRQNKSILAYKG